MIEVGEGEWTQSGEEEDWVTCRGCADEGSKESKDEVSMGRVGWSGAGRGA